MRYKGEVQEQINKMHSVESAIEKIEEYLFDIQEKVKTTRLLLKKIKSNTDEVKFELCNYMVRHAEIKVSLVPKDVKMEGK